jgi:murein DD-endopeptidase MepM/ murein hydrolase activator NlpD
VCTSADTAPATYTVVDGDGWLTIAQAASTTPQSLLDANDARLTAELHPGDVLCLPQEATPTPDVSGCGVERRIVDGDSWFGIARELGVPVATLLAANTATIQTVLYTGESICLPAGAPASATPPASCTRAYTAVVGDSWYAIASRAGVTVTALLAANDASTNTVLQPGDDLCLPAGAAPANTTASCTATATVAPGESWYVISRSTGVPLPALYAANDARSSTVLNAGDRLCLPGVGSGGGAGSRNLDVGPVRGWCRFANSWGAARSGGRRHVGVDLVASSGAPVVAVVAGTLTRQSRDRPGSLSGNAWWLTTGNGTYYFYAHLAAFAPGLEVGSTVRAGDVIGYVGSTGNAASPHLHFELHPYGGGPINPYDAVWMAGGCVLDRRYEQATYD